MLRAFAFLLIGACQAGAQTPQTASNVHLGEAIRGTTVHWVLVGAPSNLSYDHGLKTLSRAKELASVVTNGTFFSGATALGDVIVRGQKVHYLTEDQRVLITADGRYVDIGERWGLGVDRNGRAVVRKGKDADDLWTYLGGAGLLLEEGDAMTHLNVAQPGRYGASFAPDVLDARRPRTALGIRADGRIVLAAVPKPGATVAGLARIMLELGCRDAVFYDGGRATGLSLRDQDEPVIRPQEDLNPSHILAEPDTAPAAS